MKKIASIVLIIFMTLSLMGCDDIRFYNEYILTSYEEYEEQLKGKVVYDTQKDYYAFGVREDFEFEYCELGGWRKGGYLKEIQFEPSHIIMAYTFVSQSGEKSTVEWQINLDSSKGKGDILIGEYIIDEIDCLLYKEGENYNVGAFEIAGLNYIMWIFSKDITAEESFEILEYGVKNRYLLRSKE